MTIIVTHLNCFGIVHASDSNNVIRVGGKISLRTAVKLFQIPHLKAAVTVSGNALLGEESIEDWMPTFIEQEARNQTSTLKEFSEHLRDSWFESMTEEQRRIGNWAHIAGYASNGVVSYPECWFVSNILKQEINNFEVDERKFHRWEDFATRDCRVPRDLISEFSQNDGRIGWTYLNGYPTGRILHNFLNQLRSQPHPVNSIIHSFVIKPSALAANVEFEEPVTENQVEQFRAIIGPALEHSDVNSLKETEEMVIASIEVIGKLFEIGQIPTIGGVTQHFCIPAPEDLARSADQLPTYNGLTN